MKLEKESLNNKWDIKKLWFLINFSQSLKSVTNIFSYAYHPWKFVVKNHHLHQKIKSQNKNQNKKRRESKEKKIK